MKFFFHLTIGILKTLTTDFGEQGKGAREFSYKDESVSSITHPYLLLGENLLASFSFSFHFFPLLEFLRNGAL